MPNLAAEYAVQNSCPIMPPVDEIATTRPLLAHDGQYRAGYVQRPEQVCLDLRAEVVGRDLFEEPGVEVAGVVDEHIDLAEPIHRSLGGGLCIFDAGNVKFDDHQVVVFADGRSDSFRVAPRGDDRVAGCQCRLRNVGPHTPARAGD
jgi:hypothetical protein